MLKAVSWWSSQIFYDRYLLFMLSLVLSFSVGCVSLALPHVPHEYPEYTATPYESRLRQLTLPEDEAELEDVDPVTGEILILKGDSPSGLFLISPERPRMMQQLANGIQSPRSAALSKNTLIVNGSQFLTENVSGAISEADIFRYRLFATSKKTTAAAQFLAEGQGSIHGMDVSDDGKRVVFSSDNEMWMIMVETGQRYALGKGISPTWSPSGQQIVFTRPTEKIELFAANNRFNVTVTVGTLWRISWDGSQVTQLIPEKLSPNTTLEESAVSPDGKYVAFVRLRYKPLGNIGQANIKQIQAASRLSRASSNIWLLNLETSVQTKLTSHPGLDSSPKWSPDGKVIYFQSTRASSLAKEAQCVWALSL
jgi:Tol biopolymer transport system component